MTGMNKTYRAFGRDIQALRDAELFVQQGTVHGLLGENGAGKTTLMKILAGVELRNSGAVCYQGRELHFKNAMEASRAGIGMVHQHFSLLDRYTVTENVVLGMEPSNKLGVIDEKRARDAVRAAARRCKFDIDPDQKVGTLSMGQRQKVEILRVLYSNADVLIFDEPTSVLVEQEIASLLDTIRMLKQEGKTIIYISHKVEEVLAITDEVTILRNGVTVHTAKTSELVPGAMVRLMVGKDLNLQVARQPQVAGEPLLSVEDLWVKSGLVHKVRGINFEVRAGEIVAVAGINGNGQQELLEAVFGLRAPARGAILLQGEDVKAMSPRQRRARGMGYIPEDRIHVGSCATGSIAENIIIDRYFKKEYMKAGWLRWKPVRRDVRQLIQTYNIKAPDPDHYVGALSGGHIQRTILARELSCELKVLLACEVTMGLDVASARYIHDVLLTLREQGRGVLLVSSNMSEILSLADRILVVHMGELTACLDNTGTLSREEIGEYMLGLKYQEGYGPKFAPGTEAAHA